MSNRVNLSISYPRVASLVGPLGLSEKLFRPIGTYLLSKSIQRNCWKTVSARSRAHERQRDLRSILEASENYLLSIDLLDLSGSCSSSCGSRGAGL